LFDLLVFLKLDFFVFSFCFYFLFVFVFVCFFLFDSMCDFSFSFIVFERELFDLFGLFFVGNDFCCRVLSDWCCFFFCCLKDFPLFGFFVFLYDVFGFDLRLLFFAFF